MATLGPLSSAGGASAKLLRTMAQRGISNAVWKITWRRIVRESGGVRKSDDPILHYGRLPRENYFPTGVLRKLSKSPTSLSCRTGQVVPALRLCANILAPWPQRFVAKRTAV